MEQQMVLENGTALFKNGCSIFKLGDGAAPFKNRASLKMEPNISITDCNINGRQRLRIPLIKISGSNLNVRK